MGPRTTHSETRRVLADLYPRLRRFAFGLTGSLEDAEDLVQAAYERALARLDQWHPGTRLDSWMYSIVQSIRSNQLRSDRVRGKHLNPVDPESQPGGDLRREVEASLTLEAVRRFLVTLPEEQRVVILLVCVEGLSYGEVSETLGIPIGTVTSRLGRGRTALRQFVENRQTVSRREGFDGEDDTIDR